jgi:hypothetical protein
MNGHTGEQAAQFHRRHGGDVVSIAGSFGVPKNFVVVAATRSEKMGPLR